MKGGGVRWHFQNIGNRNQRISFVGLFLHENLWEHLSREHPLCDHLFKRTPLVWPFVQENTLYVTICSREHPLCDHLFKKTYPLCDHLFKRTSFVWPFVQENILYVTICSREHPLCDRLFNKTSFMWPFLELFKKCIYIYISFVEKIISFYTIYGTIFK